MQSTGKEAAYAALKGSKEVCPQNARHGCWGTVGGPIDVAVISKGKVSSGHGTKPPNFDTQGSREIRYTRRPSFRRRSPGGSKEKEMRMWLAAGAPTPPPPPTATKIKEDIKRQAQRDATSATNAVKGGLRQALRDVPPPKPRMDENRRESARG